MTSAVDIIAPKPAARPEPVAKASSRDDDRTTFADVLDAETSEPEAAPATKEVSKEAAPKEAVTKDEPATPDTNVAAQPAQPQQPQPTPAVNSAEAILAGLTQAAPTDAPITEAGAATPAIDAAAPAAPAAAAPAGAAETSAAAAATAAQATPKPVATPQPAAPQADAAAEPTAQAIAPAATPATTPAVAAQTAQAAQAAPTIAATPAADTAAPLSAPGEERTSATVEAANTSSNKTAATSATSTAVDPAASKAQGAQSRTTQVAANVASEATPDIKPDAAPPATTTTVDPLATARNATETARAAQTSPALQNAPATTIQVYQRMVERFDGRAQRYEVRLDPAELGRVDVRIEVGADKKVHAVLAAHDSAALSDLMRGQRSLERALNDAGFDLAEGGIRFELSSDQGRNPANDSNGNGRSNVWRGFNTVDVAVDAQTAAAARPWRSSARLDVVA